MSNEILNISKELEKNTNLDSHLTSQQFSESGLSYSINAHPKQNMIFIFNDSVLNGCLSFHADASEYEDYNISKGVSLNYSLVADLTKKKNGYIAETPCGQKDVLIKPTDAISVVEIMTEEHINADYFFIPMNTDDFDDAIDDVVNASTLDEIVSLFYVGKTQNDVVDFFLTKLKLKNK